MISYANIIRDNRQLPHSPRCSNTRAYGYIAKILRQLTVQSENGHRISAHFLYYSNQRKMTLQADNPKPHRTGARCTDAAELVEQIGGVQPKKEG